MGCGEGDLGLLGACLDGRGEIESGVFGGGEIEGVVDCDVTDDCGVDDFVDGRGDFTWGVVGGCGEGVRGAGWGVGIFEGGVCTGLRGGGGDACLGGCFFGKGHAGASLLADCDSFPMITSLEKRKKKTM